MILRFNSYCSLAAFLMISIFFGSCRPAQKSAEPNRKKETAPKIETGKSIRVSFFSRGEGINGQAREKFEAELPREAKSKGISYELQTTHWGREGETDICITLSVNSTQAQFAEILRWCRQFAETHDRIYVGENEPCKGQ